MIAFNTEALKTRDEIAAFLSDHGFRVTSATLATKATRGGGPEFEYFGRNPLYRLGTALEWAKSRLSAPVKSTSERRTA